MSNDAYIPDFGDDEELARMNEEQAYLLWYEEQKNNIEKLSKGEENDK